MAARASNWPRTVSTSTPPPFAPQEMRVTGLESSTGMPAASLASSAPKPWRHKRSLSRSAEREKSIAETSLRSLAQPNGPSTNSMVGRQAPRSLGSAWAQERSSCAMRPRSRWWRAPFRPDSPPSRLRAHSGARCARAARAAPDRDRARSGSELRHRIEVRHVDPVGAAIKRNPEQRRVGDATSADRRARLDQGKAPAGGAKTPRRRDAGGARPHDDHIDHAGTSGVCEPGAVSGHRRARRCRQGPERRRRRHGGRGGEERPAVQSFHDVRRANRE